MIIFANGHQKITVRISIDQSSPYIFFSIIFDWHDNFLICFFVFAIDDYYFFLYSKQNKKFVILISSFIVFSIVVVIGKFRKIFWNLRSTF